MKKTLIALFALGTAILMSASAWAQQPPPYGTPITLEQAMKAAAAARAEMKKNNWSQVIAVVEPSGALVYLERDGAQYGSIGIAQNKAITAAVYRRPSKAFQDRLGQNDLSLLTLGQGLTASEGGVPIIVGGKLIGAIGVSGGTSAQDGQVAQAGVNAVK